MATLTPMEVYWVMQMDDLVTAVHVMTFPASLFLIVAFAFQVQKSVRIASCFLLIALFVLAAFLPSTKTLAAAYIAPAIVNSKGMAKLEGASLKLFDLLDKRLTDELSGGASVSS